MTEKSTRSKLPKALVPILILTASAASSAQEPDTSWESISDHQGPLVREWSLQAGFFHRHQDYFDRTFSLQGLEVGALVNRSLFAGLYGSAFATNLEARGTGPAPSYWLAEWGVELGSVRHEGRVLHGGWRLDLGAFALEGLDPDQSGFVTEGRVRVDGLVLSPQAFAEANVARWMKFRAGLGASLHSFRPVDGIAKSDLDAVFLDFGFLFGNFGKAGR